MSSPPPKSLVPSPTVWPPSNPSGTVIPFPLPWGQTGCCPPGGMDALMKCYCDIQQASAFIGQIMLDQINNNPAIIAAIIAGIEASGSSLPTIGVTNGSDAQPGQVGEFVQFITPMAYSGAVGNVVTASVGVLQPGDWDCFGVGYFNTEVGSAEFTLAPQPTGFSADMSAVLAAGAPLETISLVLPTVRASLSVPTLVVAQLTTNTTGSGAGAGVMQLFFDARRAR